MVKTAKAMIDMSSPLTACGFPALLSGKGLDIGNLAIRLLIAPNYVGGMPLPGEGNGNAFWLHLFLEKGVVFVFSPCVLARLERDLYSNHVREQLGQYYEVIMKRCPVLIAFTTKGSIVPIFCGQWSCPRCRKMLSRKWAGIALLGVRTLEGKARFWTFTMLPRYTSVRQAYKVLPKLWDSLRKEMQRKYDRWDYLAVVEGQPERDNMPHFHIISMCPIPDTYPRVKEFALHHGFGYEAYDKPVTGRQASAYVAKYTTKGDPEMPRGFRRIRPSKFWPKLPDDENYDAYIVQGKSESLLDYLLRVEDITGVDIDTLHGLWENGQGLLHPSTDKD